MQTQIVEVTNGPRNWGKFRIEKFSTDEWRHPSSVGVARRLLPQLGWTAKHRHVLDLQTGEGFIVAPGGSAHADLEKHRIWVCPMFEPFLEWWYKHWPTVDVGTFPAVVDLPDAEFSMYGYRRPAEPWNDDLIQFARLLSEIVATQDNLDIGELRESMDLTTAEIDELFERAHQTWERTKETHT